MKRATWAVVLALAASSLASRPAHADPSDRARAEQLFEQGKSLRGSGQDAAACTDFEESRRLDDGIGVTLYLADCYEHLGYPGRALTEFRRAEELARTRNDSRWSVAKKRADALDPLGVEPAAPPPGPSTPSDGPTQAGAAAPSAAAATPTTPTTPTTASSGGTRRWIGGLLAGAGVVGLGIGTAFGAIAMAKLSQSNAGPCGPDDRCTDAGLSLRQDASAAATASTVGFAAGIAALAGGVALYVTAPRAPEHIAIVPALLSGGGAVDVAGRF